MRTLLVAATLVLGSIQIGQAETCHEKFLALMVNGNGDKPVKIHVTQKIKGGMTSTNEFFQLKTGHWMTVMIDPANQPSVLTYNNTMFTSSDKGKSWKRIRNVDSAKNKQTSIKNQRENAKTIKNAACGSEDLEGVAHDVVEADFNTLQNFKTENHYKYWVNSKTGWISKAEYQTKGTGFESFTTQLIEMAPDLTLPTPE